MSISIPVLSDRTARVGNMGKRPTLIEYSSLVTVFLLSPWPEDRRHTLYLVPLHPSPCFRRQLHRYTIALHQTPSTQHPATNHDPTRILEVEYSSGNEYHEEGLHKSGFSCRLSLKVTNLGHNCGITALSDSGKSPKSIIKPQN
jgi:hypothetical protein